MGGDDAASYEVHHDLQELMQDLVGIVRSESELVRALGESAGFAKGLNAFGWTAIVSIIRGGTQPRPPQLADGLRSRRACSA